MYRVSFIYPDLVRHLEQTSRNRMASLHPDNLMVKQNQSR